MANTLQATKLPLVGGHEGSGVVVARGELVDDVQVSIPPPEGSLQTDHLRLATMSVSSG